jgi:hypothetical protein
MLTARYTQGDELPSRLERIRNPEVALIILELLGETIPEVQRDVFQTLNNTLRFSTKSLHALFSSGKHSPLPEAWPCAVN